MLVACLSTKWQQSEAHPLWESKREDQETLRGLVGTSPRLHLLRTTLSKKEGDIRRIFQKTMENPH